MNTLPDKPALSRVFRMQWEETQNNYVLLYPEGMVKLNGSAAEILKRCDGRHSVPAIVADLEQASAPAACKAMSTTSCRPPTSAAGSPES